MTTFARIRPDRRVVKVTKDGHEVAFPSVTARSMSEAQVHAAAVADRAARPMTPEELRRARRVPRVKTLRHALGCTQEEFAARYHIPLGTLRDWEQGRTEPDQPARAYLRIIARDPDRVHQLLTSA